MISINISTEVPKFFRDLHPLVRLNFKDYFYKFFTEEEVAKHNEFLEKIVSHYNLYGYLGAKYPIKNNFVIINEAHSYDLMGQEVIKNDVTLNIKDIYTSVDILDGYIYEGDIKASRTQYMSDHLINDFLSKIEAKTIIDKIISEKIHVKYELENSKKSDEYELDLYNKWIIHNIKLLNYPKF